MGATPTADDPLQSLYGAASLTLDGKGRIAIPARFRDVLLNGCGGEIVLTLHWQRPCLLLFPQPNWRPVQEKLANLPNTNEDVEDLQRFVLGYATDTKMDGQGRILLPPELRAEARMDKDVTMLGQLSKFELWDTATLQQHRQASTKRDRAKSSGESPLANLKI
jgi:MraZ protein